MRICLVINSLRCGGAERVAVTLANEWLRAGHHVSLVTLAPVGLDFYPLDHRVDRLGLHLMKRSHGLVDGIAANVRRLRRLRRELTRIRPDAIVSFVDCMNVLVLIAAAGPTRVWPRSTVRGRPCGV
jgi:GalNAc-alpha-(1->4)-GalNAc-alpha-(1->3)-diNAcBac-PP-undecaprenol alpha-1,4-N-acetyl-D-galactosaminyltransferase